MAEVIAIIVAAIVIAFALIRLAVRLRRGRRYVFLRLVDGKTNQPIAGANVFGLRSSGTQATVKTVDGGLAFVPTGAGKEERILLGQLDDAGELQREFSPTEYGALWIEAPRVAKGVIGIESVADYDRFPDEPYVCTVAFGIIAPPRKRSNLVRGLAPGQVATRREGYTNLYERPELYDTVICYATLEEAKRHSHGPMFDRFWKVEGVYVTDVMDGFQLEVEHVERAS